MIASVLKLSRENCRTLGIKDCYGIHKVVYSLFPKIEGTSRDFLYVDKGGNALYRQILMLSKRPPKNPRCGLIESKIIPEHFLNHDHYGFEVRLNPTKRDNSTGKTVAVQGKENLKTWLLNKSLNWGFSIESDSLNILSIGVQEFTKDNYTITHGEATFRGELRVTDRKNFICSFSEGIGRAKGFGFGFLQIVPLQNQEK